LVFKIHFFLFKIGIADYEKDVWKVNKKTEKEIPHDGEIKEVKEMSIEEKKPSVEQIMNRFSSLLSLVPTTFFFLFIFS